MENSDFYRRNRQQNDGLGVNKIGRNIRKSPPQTHVCISKKDFRSVVQQLTGSSSHKLPTSSLRLQKIRPPPLSPFNQNNPSVSISNSHMLARSSPPLSRAESPISAYMRYLQTSIIGSGPGDLQEQPAPPITSPDGAATAQLPSPSSFLNLLSPRSPFPLLSPAFQLPSPTFIFPQQTPLSPSALLPPSPSSFFAFSSPEWRT